MKNCKKAGFLPWAIVLSGIIALLLRRQLFLTAVDARGLLMSHTLWEILLLALTAAVACMLLLTLKKDRGSSSYEDNYSASIPAALGHAAAALGILVLVRGGNPGMAGVLGRFWQVLGLAAPVCLVLAGAARLFGRKPFFLLHVIPCLFLLVYVVGSYRVWSSEPQMQNYLFALLAALALILFAHYTAAFEAGLGNRKMVLGAGLAAVYLCLAELGWSDEPGLYLGGMLWALTGVCKVSAGAAAEKD